MINTKQNLINTNFKKCFKKNANYVNKVKKTYPKFIN